MSITVAVVVVTFNRKELLQVCLQAIVAQTRRPDRIVIVDNASTDGTRDMLSEQGWLARGDTELLALRENTGGAGGFAAGIGHAAGNGTDWIWVMDDDAQPHPDALAELVAVDPDPGNLYGSVAVTGDRLSWPMMPMDGSWRDTIHLVAGLPERVDVQFIPFLGLLIGAALVKRIGLPDPDFFIAADDVDYCLRARKAGCRIVLVGRSRIEHPASERYHVPLPWRPFYSLRLSPWKRYYDVRNRIFVARNHYGAALYYSTIPGSFLCLFATLWHERDRPAQIKAFVAGMYDGLLGRKGCRHRKWGITK